METRRGSSIPPRRRCRLISHFSMGPHKGETCQGIYEWTGDEAKKLKISIQDPGAEVGRPTDFKMKKGSQTSLIALRSIPPIDPVKEPASSEELPGAFDILSIPEFLARANRNRDRQQRTPERKADGGQRESKSLPRTGKGEEIRSVIQPIDPFQTPKQHRLLTLSQRSKQGSEVSWNLWKPQMGNDKIFVGSAMTNPWIERASAG